MVKKSKINKSRISVTLDTSNVVLLDDLSECFGMNRSRVLNDVMNIASDQLRFVIDEFNKLKQVVEEGVVVDDDYINSFVAKLYMSAITKLTEEVNNKSLIGKKEINETEEL